MAPSPRPSIPRRARRIRSFTTQTIRTLILESESRGHPAHSTERRLFERVLEFTTVPPRMMISMPAWRATGSQRLSISTQVAPARPCCPLISRRSRDLSGVGTDVTNLQQPRALQRQGRRDLYVETWGLTVDHELPANFLASAQYLGSRGVRLFSRGGVNFCITKPDVNGNCTRTLDQFYPGGDPYGSVDLQIGYRCEHLPRPASQFGASFYQRSVFGDSLHLVSLHQRRISRWGRV